MAGIKFTFTGDNQDVLKKINQIQTELKKVYNKQNTNIDLSNGIDFSLLGENFKRLDQQSREAFDSMSKDAQKYIQEIQQNTLSLQQLEKMQAGLNSLFEDGDVDLNTYIQSQARLTVLHEELSKGINESRAALEAETTTTKIAADSIAGLHAKVLMLTTDYMNLSKAQREGMEGAALLKNLQETQAQLDNASLSMDRYASGAKSKFDSLGMSVTQIARELPSLAMGPQMFFLAISNNLGPFQDALAAARKEYKDMIAAGKDAIPVWKQLLSSLKGSGPILALITTLFVAFGDDIIEWVGKLISGKKEMKSFLYVAQEMALGIRKGMKDAAASTTELDVLYKATQNHTRSLKERNKAVDELQKKYPSYFGNLSNEAVLAGKAKDAYAKLRGELVANAIARAQLDRMTDIANKREDVLLKRRVQYNTYLKAQQKINEASAALEEARQKRAQQQGGDDVWGYQVAKRTKDLEKAQKQAEKEKDVWQKLVDEVQKYDNTLSGMAKNVDVSALTNKPGETDTKEINAYSDHLHRIAELQSKSSRERIRLEVELTNQVEQARINAMQDGFDKEQAQRELNNKIELQTIERQKQDYINKIVDIQRQIFEAEENAKATKDKNYKKRTFNASSVSVDTSMFDLLYGYTQGRQERDQMKAQEESWNEYLIKFGNYQQKRLAIIEKYNKAIETATTAGNAAILEAEKNKLLSDLDIETNKSTSAITKLFGDMRERTVSDLRTIADEAERAFQFLQSGEWDEKKGVEFGISKETFNTIRKSPEELDKIRKGIIELRREADQSDVAFNKMATGLKKVFDSGSNTKKLKEGLADIENGLNDILQVGKFLSDTLSNIGDSFGSDTLNEIAEGVNVAMGALESGMQGAKAGAMFGPIGASAGAAIGVVSSLASSIAKIHDAKNEKRIERLQDQIEDLDRAYDKLGDSIEKAYSKNASRLIEDQNKLLEQQKVLIQQQIREEEDKKKTDKGRIKEWKQQIEDINKVIEDNKEKAKDAIFGEDLKSAIDDFANSYADAWKSGEDRAKSAKNVVRDIMRQMVTESIKSAIQSSKSMEDIRKKLQEFYADNVLSGWEQDYIYNMAEQLQKELDTKFGWADNLMKDEKEGSSQDSTKRGFGTEMTHEDAGELSGRFTALHMVGEESKTQLVLLNQITNALLISADAGFNNILLQMIQTNSYLEDIYTIQKKMWEQWGSKIDEVIRGINNAFGR